MKLSTYRKISDYIVITLQILINFVESYLNS